MTYVWLPSFLKHKLQIKQDKYTMGSQIYRRNQKKNLSKNLFLKKIIKKHINYAKFIPNYASYKHNLHWLGAYDLNKASCEV